MLKFFKNPFAVTGTRAAIPAADPGTGEVNYPTGYPAQYQLPKTDPLSRNIERDKMNQLFFDTQQAIAELQARGTPDFITTALNEGVAFEYGVGDRVRYDDGVNGPRVFVSRVAANVDLPTVAASWAPARDFSPAAVAAGTANALTAVLSPSLGLTPTGTVFYLRHAAANTAAVTLALNGGGAKAVVKGNDQPLIAGDIPGAGSWGAYVYDLTLDKYVLLVVNALPVASTGEAQAGTADNRIITPLRLREAFNASGVAPVYAARAFVNFNGVGVPAIRSSGNISSIIDNGVGDYTLNLSNALPDANPVVTGAVSSPGAASGVFNPNFVVPPTASAIRIGVLNTSFVVVDLTYVNVVIHR